MQTCPDFGDRNCHRMAISMVAFTSYVICVNIGLPGHWPLNIPCVDVHRVQGMAPCEKGSGCSNSNQPCRDQRVPILKGHRLTVNWWLMISGFRGGNGSKMLYDAISLHVGTFTTKTIRDMKIRFLGWSTRSSSCLAFSCFFILRGAFAWRVRWWLHQHASNATLRLIGWDHDLLSASAPLGDAMCRGRRLWMVATQKLILLWCMNGLDGWGGFHAYITFTKSSKSKWWYFVYGKYGKSSICAINQIKRRLLLDHRRRLQFPHSMVLDRISSWAQGKNRAPPPVFQWIFQDGSKSWT